MIQRLLFKSPESTPGILALLNFFCRSHRKQLPAAAPLLTRSSFRPGRASRNHLRSRLREAHGLLGSSAGQGLTEYLVLLLLIAVISIGAARTLGRTIQGKLQMAERHIEDVQLERRD